MKIIGLQASMVEQVKASVIEQLQLDWKKYQAICVARQDAMTALHNAGNSLPQVVAEKLQQAISLCDEHGGDLEAKWSHFNVELSEHLDYSPF